MKPALRVLLLAVLLTGHVSAADRLPDGRTIDWCLGVESVVRVEDTAARLGCGRCDNSLEPVACISDIDCASGQACLGSQEEIVWYDARADSAANDLRTIAFAQDAVALYVLIDWHTWLTIVPNVQIALDSRPGGTHDLVDPLGGMVAPGFCSVSTDRGCTEDADCHFCTRTFELPTCCDEGTCGAGELCRARICGSGCEPTDPPNECDTSQTCQDLGTVPVGMVGLESTTSTSADYLITYDFGRVVVGFSEAVQLSRWTGAWTELGVYDIASAVGIPEVPHLVLETAITWDGFGCTGWTQDAGCGVDASASSCGCPDFGPGTPFRFTTVVSRASLTFDFTPSGPIEDVASEAVGGTTTLTLNSCPGPGIDTTRCELADGSTDSFGPRTAVDPGGAISGLTIGRNGTEPTPSITLRWNPSCSIGDTDYEVYEGDLNALPAYDHALVLCSTSGETGATFDAGPGDRYFLVVPTDGTDEGSYGVGADGQRPQAAVSCRSQVPQPACGG